MEYYQLYLNRIFALGKMDIRIIGKDGAEVFRACGMDNGGSKAVFRKSAFREFLARLFRDQSKLAGSILIATVHGYSFCGGSIQMAQGECCLVLGPFYLKSRDPAPEPTLPVYDSIDVVSCFLPLLFDGPYHIMLESGLREEQFIPMDETISYNDENAILKNHELENNIRSAIYQGDLNRLRGILCSDYFIPPAHYDVGDMLRAQRNNSLVLNTLASRAAMDAGVSPFYVRSLCSIYAGRIERAFAPDELSLLRRELCEHYCRLVKEKKQENFSPVVAKSIEYMRLHLSEPLTLEEVANYAGVSYAYLSRLLKKECQKSYSQIMNFMRMKRATEYLSNGMSVQESAERTGFRSSSHFCHIFKEYMGCTPTQWLSSNKAKPTE